jgi:hypothetical protein
MDETLRGALIFVLRLYLPMNGSGHDWSDMKITTASAGDKFTITACGIGS